MRESRTYGSVRGAFSNGRPYRVHVESIRCELPMRSLLGLQRTYRECHEHTDAARMTRS